MNIISSVLRRLASVREKQAIARKKYESERQAFWEKEERERKANMRRTVREQRRQQTWFASLPPELQVKYLRDKEEIEIKKRAMNLSERQQAKVEAPLWPFTD